MTATITVEWQHPGQGVPLVPQSGLLEVEAMQGWIAGDAIVHPTKEPYRVTDGVAVVTLDDSTARVWRFDHYPLRSRAYQEWVLVPLNVGAVAYTALEKIDPATLTPTPDELANALDVVAAETVTTGTVDASGALILTRGDGTPINAGRVTGDPGTNGASAYQIAVANGYVGTEAEWLASLQGSDATGPTITDNGTTLTIGA